MKTVSHRGTGFLSKESEKIKYFRTLRLAGPRRPKAAVLIVQKGATVWQDRDRGNPGRRRWAEGDAVTSEEDPEEGREGGGGTTRELTLL